MAMLPANPHNGPGRPQVKNVARSDSWCSAAAGLRRIFEGGKGTWISYGVPAFSYDRFKPVVEETGTFVLRQRRRRGSGQAYD